MWNSGGVEIGGLSKPMPSFTIDYSRSFSPTQTVRSGGLSGNILGATTNTLSGSNTQEPTYQDPYAGVTQSAQDEAAAQLAALNTEYDRNAAEGQAQIDQAGVAKQQGLTTLQNALDEYGNLVKNQKLSAEQSGEKNIQSAGSAARQTQGKSRNILRALGILSSSAAGDILSRPMTEFAGQRAEIKQAITARLQQLDDALSQKTSEHANLVAQLESTYSNLVNGILSDLRFSDRERADAVQAVNAALASKISDIKMAQANWQNQINAQKNALASSTTALSNYANPTADIGAIQNTALNPQQQYNPQRYQASIYGTDKDKLSGIYG